jgi:threonine/homoserine/homoserine lactone efflux protein
MSLIVANTLRGGLTAGLVTLTGTTTGLAVLVAAAVLGMSSLMVFMSEWFDVLRCIGAIYLVYLGARQLWQFYHRHRSDAAACLASKPQGLYLQGCCSHDPKVLLFGGLSDSLIP